MQFNVYGVGNSLVDVQTEVSEATLADLGFQKGLMTLVDTAIQSRVLGRLHSATLTRCAGGSAANTVMGVADFGGRAAYAGKVGGDPLGEFFLQDMRSAGVVIDAPAGDQPTGTCVILITADAQRTMLTSLGASATLGPADIDEDHIRAAQYVYIEGYLFGGEPTRSAALRAIELAKQNGVKVAFTVSDPFLIAQHRDEFWRLIRGPVDLLFCNLEESRSLTGETDPVACAHAIHRHAENVALTMGKEGSILMHAGEAIPIEGVPVTAVDTTGAGDMYAAGVLYGITSGYTWRQSGRLASYAASRIVAQRGARLPRPLTPGEIAGLL
jgi:sugar/nucleoside kinase (ribokinase family)